jgi:hypothetical protein
LLVGTGTTAMTGQDYNSYRYHILPTPQKKYILPALRVQISKWSLSLSLL